MVTAYVLSGGGSLGAVQVGMLQALAARGVEPDLLIGTSAGALNAAYVAGTGRGVRRWTTSPAPGPLQLPHLPRGRGRVSIADLTHPYAPPHLELIRGGTEIDLARAERAVAELLAALGQEADDEHLRDTPRRVAAASAEMLTPRSFNLATFPNEEGYDELVLARDIPFHSLCQHHMLPFNGVAHVGYLPGERILGLSKLARVLELFARGLQVQERLTKQVADWLQEQLDPKGSRCGDRGRAPVHVAARCAGRRLPHGHLSPPWPAPGRPPVPRRVLLTHRRTAMTALEPETTSNRRRHP